MKSALLAAAALVAFSSGAVAQAQDLSGLWTGGYVSDDGADINTFNFTLTSAGRAFTGTGTEIAGFGDGSVLFLTSTVTGRINASQQVTFTKTYDGSGGVSHSVTYVGQLDQTGRRIRGSYDAGGATGEFEMVR